MECFSKGFNQFVTKKPKEVFKWVFICNVALAILITFASFNWPFGADHGIFAWIGDVINRGGIPYRDAWDIKGPLVYYVFALAQSIFGQNMWGIRVIDSMFLLVSSISLYYLIRSLTNIMTASWASVLFVLWFFCGNFWHTAQPDGWVGFIMIIVVSFIVNIKKQIPYLYLSMLAMLISLTTLVKPIYAIFIVLLIIHLLWYRKSCPQKQFYISLPVLGIAFCVPIVTVILWFQYHGMLKDFIDVFLIYPTKIYSGVISLSFEKRIKGVIDFFLTGPVISVIFPSAILGFVILWRKSRINAILLLTWILTTMFVVIIQNKFFLYHWTPIYAPLTVLSAIGFYSVFINPFKTSDVSTIDPYDVTRKFIIITFVVLLFHTSIHPLFEVKRWLGYVTGVTSQESYYSGFDSVRSDEVLASRYIYDHTNTNDNIIIWGWNAGIVYLSERQSSSRFGFSMGLLIGEDSHTKTLYRQEFMNDLYKKPPTYVVKGTLYEKVLGRHFDLSDFPAFKKFITTNYKEEVRFGDLILYRSQSNITNIPPTNKNSVHDKL